MPRLLVNGEWFDSVAPEAIRESEFEDLLLSNSTVIYPGFHAVRFKKTIFSEYGAGRPDLALIDKQFRSWWIVEVERSSHPLRSHVEKQVAIFATAEYGLAEAQYIASRNSELDARSLRDMMRGSQPRVLVLVNQVQPAWTKTLAHWDAIVGVAEIFRSRSEQLILRINGEHPEEPGNVLSVCRVDPLLQNFLVVESPASLNLFKQETIPIWFNDSLTEWTRCESAKTVWLMPRQRYPLPSRLRSFVLLRTEDQRFIFKPSPTAHLRGT